MTPEMQKKMDELLVSADCGMFSSPDRWVGFRRGFKAAHELMQAEIEYLNRALADERSGDSDKDKTIRRLKSNLNALQEKVQVLVEALRSLTNEASGFLSQANPYDHGHTNMEVMRLRIQKSREALKGWEG